MSFVITKGLGAAGDGSPSTIIVTIGYGITGSSNLHLLSSTSIDAHLVQLQLDVKPTDGIYDAANYVCSNGLVVYSISKFTDTIYRIVTSRQDYGVVYTITINNVQAA